MSWPSRLTKRQRVRDGATINRLMCVLMERKFLKVIYNHRLCVRLSEWLYVDFRLRNCTENLEVTCEKEWRRLYTDQREM
jgi:hypothetical protein